jgi:hypothetical protein
MQEAETGSLPKPIHPFYQGYKGTDPKNPYTLCSQVTEDRLVSVHNFELLVNYSNSKM